MAMQIDSLTFFRIRLTEPHSGDAQLRIAPADDKGYLLVPLRAGACEIDWSSIEQSADAPLLVRPTRPTARTDAGIYDRN